MLEDQIKATVRDVKDYPKPGIIFKDITPVLANPVLVDNIIIQLKNDFKAMHIDALAAVEARGFIFGAMLARELNCSFIPVRKSGKLPYTSIKQEYYLEYGKASIEMHTDAIKPGQRVLVHDDLLATGGTAGATAKMVRQLGGEVVGFSFIINLSFLPGEKNLFEKFGVKPQYLVKY